MIHSSLKKFILGATLLLCPSVMTAQSDRQLAALDSVKTMDMIIFGEGYGPTTEEADSKALANLMSKISTTVESSFRMSESELHADNGIDYRQNVESVMNTYSQATLSNTKTIGYKAKNGEFYRMRYIMKSELDKMFSRRRDRVEDYVRSALRSEDKGRVDDALRFLNSAYVLLHSLQYPAEQKMNVEGDDRLLINWIPSKMRSILDGVGVEVAEVGKENTVDVLFTYKGKPAAGIDFTYWNGKVNSPVCNAKDGLGQLSFPPDYKITNVSLKIETAYTDASQSDRELSSMLTHFKPLDFPTAGKSIGVEGKELKAEKAATKEFQNIVAAGKDEGILPLAKGDTKEYGKIISDVLKSIKTKSYKPNSDYFTEEGLDVFKRLLGYGKATILGTPDPGYYPSGNGVTARSIPMRFSFSNNTREFVENVNFIFSADKKIENITFGLGDVARNDIFRQGEGVWGDSVKMIIADFLENYKTAFALKRLEYIKSIFDEDAYIIVGHKLNKLTSTKQDDITGMSSLPDYEFQKKTKKEYIDQLEVCFKNNEYVNINFADNDIQKSALGGNTFGIQIQQDYFSKTYGDRGYLFLFVDLNEPGKPIIKIRTWQPERNPDLTPMLPKNNRDYGIYSNSSFQ